MARAHGGRLAAAPRDHELGVGDKWIPLRDLVFDDRALPGAELVRDDVDLQRGSPHLLPVRDRSREQVRELGNGEPLDWVGGMNDEKQFRFTERGDRDAQPALDR